MRRIIRDNFKDITSYAHQEIDRVRSIYKWFASLLGVIFVFGVSIIAIVSYNNVKDIREEMRSETDRITKNINDRLNLIADIAKFDLEKEVFMVEQEVRERIKTEFDRENIKQLVEKTATEKVGMYTDAIIRERISDGVQPLLADAKKEILNLSTKLSDANLLNQKNLDHTKNEINNLLINSRHKLDSLRTILDFVMTVASAQSGNRKDWEKLKSISQDDKSTFSKMAGDAFIRVKDDFSNQFTAIRFIDSLKIDKNIDQSKISIENSYKDYIELNNNAQTVDAYYLRLQFVKYIWERKDYNLKDKLEFLINVLKNDNHLYVVQYAGRLFSEHTKLQIKYLAVDYFVNWWDKNKQKYN